MNINGEEYLNDPRDAVNPGICTRCKEEKEPSALLPVYSLTHRKIMNWLCGGCIATLFPKKVTA